MSNFSHVRVNVICPTEPSSRALGAPLAAFLSVKGAAARRSRLEGEPGVGPVGVFLCAPVRRLPQSLAPAFLAPGG